MEEQSRNALPPPLSISVTNECIWRKKFEKMHYFWSTTTCKVKSINFLVGCFQRCFPSTIHTDSYISWKEEIYFQQMWSNNGPVPSLNLSEKIMQWNKTLQKKFCNQKCPKKGSLGITKVISRNKKESLLLSLNAFNHINFQKN